MIGAEKLPLQVADGELIAGMTRCWSVGPEGLRRVEVREITAAGDIIGLDGAEHWRYRCHVTLAKAAERQGEWNRQAREYAESLLQRVQRYEAEVQRLLTEHGISLGAA